MEKGEQKEKELYWYRVIEATGDMKNKELVGRYVGEKQSKGKEYTWHIFNHKLGKETGSFTGISIGQHPNKHIAELEKLDNKQKK